MGNFVSTNAPAVQAQIFINFLVFLVVEDILSTLKSQMKKNLRIFSIGFHKSILSLDYLKLIIIRYESFVKQLRAYNEFDDDKL
jgi:hypothetical protein